MVTTLFFGFQSIRRTYTKPTGITSKHTCNSPSACIFKPFLFVLFAFIFIASCNKNEKPVSPPPVVVLQDVNDNLDEIVLPPPVDFGGGAVDVVFYKMIVDNGSFFHQYQKANGIDCGKMACLPTSYLMARAINYPSRSTTIQELNRIGNAMRLSCTNGTAISAASVFSKTDIGTCNPDLGSTSDREIAKSTIKTNLQIGLPTIALIRINTSTATSSGNYLSSSGGLNHFVCVVGLQETLSGIGSVVYYLDPLDRTAIVRSADYTLFLNSSKAASTRGYYNLLAVGCLQDVVSGTQTKLISLTGDMVFNNVVIGNTVSKPLTISNTGNSVLTLTSFSLPSGYSSNFVFPFTLNPNQSTTADIAFTPQNMVSVYTGTIYLYSDATGGNGTIAVIGNGVNANVNETRVLNIQPNNLSFGNQIVNSTASQNVVIANTGNSSCVITSIDFPVGYTSNFTNNTVVASGGNITVTVMFNPTTVSAYNDVAYIHSNQTSGDNAISLSGYGINNTVTPTRIVSLSQSNIDFGGVNVNGLSTRQLTISNSGNSPLTVNSISFPNGYSSPNFNNGTVIQSNNSITIDVNFNPTSNITYNGTAYINSNATSGTNSFNLSGYGVAQVVQTRIIDVQGDLNFGSVYIGNSSQRFVTIKNNGTAPLTINSLNVPNGFVSDYQSGTIQAGYSTTANITFTPVFAGTYNGNLTVNSDATSGNNALPIYATGVQQVSQNQPSFSPIIEAYTNCIYQDITGTSNCSGYTYKNEEKLKVVAYNNTTNTITFRIAKCNDGQFIADGLAYIKQGGYCGGVVAQLPYYHNQPYTQDLLVTPPTRTGVYTYTGVLVPNNADTTHIKYYTLSVTVSY